MKLVGILGRKRVGKDTSADYIVEKYGFAKIAIANPLKDACKLLFNLTDEDMENRDVIHPKWGVTPRTFLKYFGTEIFRNDINRILPNIKNNFWIKICIDKCLNMGDRVIISDVRFQNEIDLIHENGGIIIKVINDNVPKDIDENYIERLSGDYTIYNEATYEDLYKKIDEIIEKI